MARKAQQIDVQLLHVHRDVPHGLHRVAVEGDAPLPAERADLPHGLERADFVVGQHHGHEAAVLPQRVPDGLRAQDPVGRDVQQRHLKALLFQSLEGVQNCVVLEFGGDQVLFSLPRPQTRAGDQSLVVALAAAGGEDDLPRLRPETAGDRGPRLLHRLADPLRRGIEGGGIEVVLAQPGQHGLPRGSTDPRGGGVIGIDKHGARPFPFRYPQYSMKTPARTVALYPKITQPFWRKDKTSFTKCC